MAIFNGSVFEGQRIRIDNHVFTGNTFENCVLVYGGGPLTFSNNSLNNVRWEFVDGAARTLGLLSSFYQTGGKTKEFVELLLTNFGRETVQPKPTSASTT